MEADEARAAFPHRRVPALAFGRSSRELTISTTNDRRALRVEGVDEALERPENEHVPDTRSSW